MPEIALRFGACYFYRMATKELQLELSGVTLGVSLDDTSLDFLLVFYLHTVNVSTLLKLRGCS